MTVSEAECTLRIRYQPSITDAIPATGQWDSGRANNTTDSAVRRPFSTAGSAVLPSVASVPSNDAPLLIAKAISYDDHRPEPEESTETRSTLPRLEAMNPESKVKGFDVER